MQCLHQLVSILAAMWNYSLLEKSPHILDWIHVPRAGRLKQDVGYSAIEKILLCFSEVNERNFELFLLSMQHVHSELLHEVRTVEFIHTNRQ